MEDTNMHGLDLPPPMKRRRRPKTCFKIHRNKLMYSIPQDAENVDGCPLVAFSGDSVADWTVTLSWMYNRSAFESRSATFSIIAGALRISTKYEISDLRSWSKQQLLSRWPTNLLEMNSNAFPNAAEVIALARQLDHFNALSVQRWGGGGDGGKQPSHSFRRRTLRRVIVGREELEQHLVAILTCPIGESFTLCRECESCLSKWLVSRFLHSPYRSWLLRELKDILQEPRTELSPCSFCLSTFRQVVAKFIDELLHAIPRYFGL
ncbi:hypothetical protein BKA82DRAFT_4183830 [Pisolithus tinctorius]|nr:hypothetical protein BKA82DRAFT_4183830 [Pisolithus tinctorius]